MNQFGVLQSVGAIAYNPILSDLIEKPTSVETELILQQKLNTYNLNDYVENSIDFTLPGYNYLGPGTPTIHNILNGKPPVDDLDRAALVHDIEYLSGETYYADYNMYLNTNGIKSALINYAFNLKDQLIFANSFLAQKNLPAFYEAKKYVIEKGLAPESMFLSGKSKSEKEPSFFYKLTHPIGTIANIGGGNILKDSIPTTNDLVNVTPI